ncbi:mas-related G-protein coupled receptor member H-like [Catharus ustulatus]|uniref:mas-related G-protein coupled receptor member H-like n=1 Tax=Catharus ustulatus TaxID=91951 RepID=UPI00140E3871|nr:mas-related G-protein coupled receptor member H-like [Catharus ustulatus]
MEVTTVSPSPASPTEGDDLCETDVTNVAIHSVTLLICLCGLFGNGAVICLYSLKARNAIIFGLAFIEFLFLLFTVPSTVLFLVEDVSCTPIMPLTYMNFLFQLSALSYFWGLYRMTRSSIVVNMYKFCKLYCGFKLPLRLWWAVDSVQFWAFFALFTLIPTLTSLCPSHQQEHCWAALISVCAVILLLFVAPVVISITINIINAKCGSQQQQHKTRDNVIFIIVLFTLLLVLCNFLQQLGYIPVPTQVVFLLNCINSSIKPFIYFVAGRCWSPCSMESLRLSLHRVFEEEEENPADSDDANTDTLI